MLRLFKSFKQQFVTAMANGEVARRELLDIRDPSKLMRIVNGRR